MVLLVRWPGARSRQPSKAVEATTSSHFHYSPLDQPSKGAAHRFFRVLQLLPGLPSEPVHCLLETHSIADPPAYEAISYCWGDSRQNTSIICNGSLLPVTLSVLDVLVQLRHSNERRRLWIDQVCIDQDNLLERASQVPFMRLIYHNAVRTIVWLGKSDKQTKMAFECIVELARIRAELIASGTPYVRIPDTTAIQERYGLSALFEKKEVRAVWHLLEQQWFERLWIIQEVAVSRQSIVMQGEFQTSWQELSAATMLIWELRMATYASEEASVHIGMVFFIEGIREQIAARRLPLLHKLLNLIRHAKATDPRDKVYGIVSLSSAVLDLANAPTLSYEQSVEETYRQWTVYIMRDQKSLEMLSMVNRYETVGEQLRCSWVPDWRETDNNSSHHVTAWPSEKFKAAPIPAEPDFSFQDGDEVLVINGHLLDRVEAVGVTCRFTTSETIFGFSALALAFWFQMMWANWEKTVRFGKVEKYEPTGENFRDAYWKTLVFGEHGYEPEEQETVRVEFEEFYATLRQPFVVVETLRLHWSKHLWALFYIIRMVIRGLGIDGKKWHRGAGLAFTGRCNQAGGRRIIRTKEGYIGLAVHCVRKGDYVGLFKGARMPLLIRADENGWRLVGDSYVHGIMHGEAWRPDQARSFAIR
ncbi:uncharacterized protein PV09_00970 [Verruconis gallopava]|uniref:Heterokaryon incompatibility domain-containing protein n=1 Tax=Verruconis gallopava TaxID=253628 RepID=A0A0D2ANH2_9PEZI|nr:uncharacterized protein PV09_00970 [Verruconis gallopava]KIW08025.1 hypothetical protein PV09_00970 [Verruconis gallopava]